MNWNKPDWNVWLDKAKQVRDAVIESGAPELLLAQQVERLETGTFTVPVALLQPRIASAIGVGAADLEVALVDGGAELVVLSPRLRTRFAVHAAQFFPGGRLGVLAVTVKETEVTAVGGRLRRWFVALWVGLLRLLGRDPVLERLAAELATVPGITMSGDRVRFDLDVLPGAAEGLRASPVFAALGPLVTVKDIALVPAGITVQLGTTALGKSVVDGAILAVNALRERRSPT